MCEKVPSEDRTKDVIGARPNAYLIAKAMAERLLDEESGDLPVSVVRPTMIWGALKEPIPGWVVSLDGPTCNDDSI